MKNKLFKYTILAWMLWVFSSPLTAQETNTAKVLNPDAFDWTLHNLLFLIGAITVSGAIWAVFDLYNKVLISQKNLLLKEQGLEVSETIEVVKETPLWKRLYDQSWKLVPLEKEQDILLDHDYDGIKELDNVLPPWWVALFWGGVISGFAYFGYYHVWDLGPSSSEEYVAEMEYAKAQVAQFLSRQVEQVDENNVTVIVDENKINFGRSLFVANCIACHGEKGEGGIGPNMTDKYWIHGGHINDIFKTIKYGVPAKGMTSWKSQFRAADIQNIASYILTLQGTNPANGKDPQGELYEPKEEIATSINE